MAETSSQERTERATPKRLREARKRGEVPRSRELVTAIVIGAAVLVLLGAGAGMAAQAFDVFRNALTLDRALLDQPARLPGHFLSVLGQGLMALLPVFGIGLLAALAGPLMLGGWNFSAEAMQPKFERLDPFKGLGRMFAWHSLVELGKGLAKVFLLGGITALFVWRKYDEMLALAGLPVESAIAAGVGLAVQCLAWLTGGLFIVAAIDAPYQVWHFAQQLRMTRQEIREEFKEAEGRPEVKARIRRLQQEMSQRRMMEKVPAADVVVTNPTHYAVALQYAAGTMRAPQVVAMGAGHVALAIRELAAQHKVPIVSAPPLARALYRDADLDREIPVALYAAVAQVLTYVYQLRNWKAGPPPQPPVIGEVPNGQPDPEGEAQP